MCVEIAQFGLLVTYLMVISQHVVGLNTLIVAHKHVYSVKPIKKLTSTKVLNLYLPAPYLFKDRRSEFMYL